MRTLSERLRWARERAGMTAKGLDRLADLTPGHTTMIELGQRSDPSVSTVEALAEALGVSLDWLVSGKGRPPARLPKAS